MQHPADLAFYCFRRQQALQFARVSTSPEARHVHRTLAARYAELIRESASTD